MRLLAIAPIKHLILFIIPNSNTLKVVTMVLSIFAIAEHKDIDNHTAEAKVSKVITEQLGL